MKSLRYLKFEEVVGGLGLRNSNDRGFSYLKLISEPIVSMIRFVPHLIGSHERTKDTYRYLLPDMSESFMACRTFKSAWPNCRKLLEKRFGGRVGSVTNEIW